jgi:8-oxo-dGTP diphosphatase
VLAKLGRLLAGIEADTSQLLIVAAAIFGDQPTGSNVGQPEVGTVLVARRSHPPRLAGLWEFPGGKVERGETAERAIVRECAEELGCRVRVQGELARQALDTMTNLVLLRVCLDADSAPPVPLEHSELRWAGAADLAELDWVATNRQFVPNVIAQLSLSATVPPRGTQAAYPPNTG